MQKVTIISVFHNREDSVEESVSSLLNQTYKNLEIILYDDGSTDSTLLKLQNCSQRDDRVVILHHDNLGFTNTIIKAIGVASGELIAIHGSGDLSYPQRIEKQVDFLNKNLDVGVVGCHFHRKDLVLGKSILVERKGGYDVVENICVSHGEVMFRKDIYDRVGGYRPFFLFSQDRDLWLRMSLLCKLAYVPESLYCAYTRQDGVTGNPFKRAIQLYYAEMSKQMYLMRKARGWDFIDKYKSGAWALRKKSSNLGKQLAIHALWCFRQGYVQEALYVSKLARQEAISVTILAVHWGLICLKKFKNGPKVISNFLDIRRKFRLGM